MLSRNNSNINRHPNDIAFALYDLKSAILKLLIRRTHATFPSRHLIARKQLPLIKDMECPNGQRQHR